jgi:hypothetical protein
MLADTNEATKNALVLPMNTGTTETSPWPIVGEKNTLTFANSGGCTICVTDGEKNVSPSDRSDGSSVIVPRPTVGEKNVLVLVNSAGANVTAPRVAVAEKKEFVFVNSAAVRPWLTFGAKKLFELVNRDGVSVCTEA